MNYQFKLKIEIVTLFLSYASLCYAGDFRKGNFGMTFEEIKKLEPNFTYSAEGQTSQGNLEILSKYVKLLDKEAVASYWFIDGIFVWGIYEILEKHENSQVWFDEFLSFESSLTNKYGTPNRSQVKNWTGTLKLFEDKVEGLSDRAELIPYIIPGIEAGLLTIVSTWNKPNVTIALRIGRNNNNTISLGIYYISLKYTDMMREGYLKDL